MLTKEILDYIREQLAAGVPKENLQRSLASVGWGAQDITDAFFMIEQSARPAPPAEPQVPVAPAIEAQNPNSSVMAQQSAEATNSPGQITGELPSAWQLLSESWALYRLRFGVLLALYAIPVLLVFAGEMLPLYGGPVAGEVVCIGLGFILLFCAYYGAILSLHRGSNVGQSLAGGSALLLPGLWLGILTCCVLVGGFALLVVPGVMMSIQFFVAAYVFALEGRRGLGALIQSREYVRGYWWPIAVRSIIVSFVVLIVYYAVSIPFDFAAAFAFLKAGGDPTKLRDFSSAVMIIPSLLISTFGLVYGYKVYQYLKALKPSLEANPATKGRGFLIFCAVFGPIAYIILMVLFVSMFLWMAAFFGNSIHLNSPATATSTAFTASTTVQLNQTVGAQPTTTQVMQPNSSQPTAAQAPSGNSSSTAESLDNSNLLALKTAFAAIQTQAYLYSVNHANSFGEQAWTNGSPASCTGGVFQETAVRNAIIAAAADAKNENSIACYANGEGYLVGVTLSPNEWWCIDSLGISKIEEGGLPTAASKIKSCP
ncbi:MAG: hypothetical protein WAN50_04415 [Minisyncoccia bacterium]